MPTYQSIVFYNDQRDQYGMPTEYHHYLVVGSSIPGRHPTFAAWGIFAFSSDIRADDEQGIVPGGEAKSLDHAIALLRKRHPALKDSLKDVH